MIPEPGVLILERLIIREELTHSEGCSGELRSASHPLWCHRDLEDSTVANRSDYEPKRTCPNEARRLQTLG
jgi:hypothetical protein